MPDETRARIRAIVYEWGGIDVATHDWEGVDELIQRIECEVLAPLEAEVRRLGQPLREGAPPLLEVGPMLDGREYVYTQAPGGAIRRGVSVEEVPLVAEILREQS